MKINLTRNDILSIYNIKKILFKKIRMILKSLKHFHFQKNTYFMKYLSQNYLNININYIII